MRHFLDKKRSPLLGLLIALVLIMTPAVATAGGGEPGDSCPGDWKYAAPPYMGVLTVTHSLGGVNVAGRVDQVGNAACFGIFSLRIEGVELGDFQSWGPNDLRKTCIRNSTDGVFDCENEDGYLEVVGVGNMKYNSDATEFTANFVIMALE